MGWWGGGVGWGHGWFSRWFWDGAAAAAAAAAAGGVAAEELQLLCASEWRAPLRAGAGGRCGVVGCHCQRAQEMPRSHHSSSAQLLASGGPVLGGGGPGMLGGGPGRCAWYWCILWLILGLYWFTFLGCMAASDSDSMVLDVATHAPIVTTGVPLAGTAVAASARPAWVVGWVAGFMADFRKQFASDGRWDNGGGHKVENLTKYTDDRKAMYTITYWNLLPIVVEKTAKLSGLWREFQCILSTQSEIGLFPVGEESLYS